MTQRTLRLFLSSTFRDFGEERDLLVRQVFPALRARLKDLAQPCSQQPSGTLASRSVAFGLVYS